MDEITSTATSTGAMPFSALTKMRPKRPMPVQPGRVRPSMAPITKPMKMRSIRLTLVYFLSILFTIMISVIQ